MQNQVQGSLDEGSLESMAACPKKYEIRRLIGRGGMGIVFQAFDKELRRDLAIKLLWTDGFCDEDARERFMREAKALSVLNHPNVVKILASGLNENGYPYHVMEYLEGEPLEAELRRGPLTAARFIEVFTQVIAGLEHAHENRIAHRDLKPSNIMMCNGSQNQAGDCKIIDFGIARIELGPELAAKTITRTDAFLGSPLYMSPEQCRGERGDFRSDIYMLGCIMYECISGNTPFAADTGMEIMYKHMTEPAPQVPGLSKSNSVESKRLAELIFSCMQKDPAARPESMSVIASEINEIFSVDIDKLDLFGNSLKSRKRGKPIDALVLASLFLLLFGGSGIVWFGILHKEVKPKFVIKTEQQKIQEKITEAKSRLSTQKNSTFSNKLKQLFNLGRWQLKSTSLQNLSDAESTFTQALNLCKTNAGPADRIAACLTLRGKARWKQENVSGANVDYDQALKIIESIKEPEQHELFYDFLNEKIPMRIHQRKLSEALSLAEIASNTWSTYHDNFSIALLDAPDQHLDKQGVERNQAAQDCVNALQEIKPRNQEEAALMIEIATKYAKCFTNKKYRYPPAAAHDQLQFSESLLNHWVKDPARKAQLEKTINELKAMIIASYGSP